MSGNVNTANYCNFGSNRTSNVRVNQGPGGNSSLSLAWQTDDAPKQNIRSGSNNNYKRDNNGYGNQYQNNYQQESKNDTQKYNPITNAPSQNYNANNYSENINHDNYHNNNQNQYRNDTNDYNQGYGQQKRQPNSYNQDSYDPYSNSSSKPPLFVKRVEQPRNDPYQDTKQAIRVNQNPGGKSQFQIGGDYNYFKDDGGNDKVGSYQGKNSQQANDSYQPQRNNYRNNDPPTQSNNYQAEYQQTYMANKSNNNNRSSSQNLYTNDPYQKNQNFPSHPSQQSNQPRQPNNLHDVKFGYRVNQPPGGRSSITFG